MADTNVLPETQLAYVNHQWLSSKYMVSTASDETALYFTVFVKELSKIYAVTFLNRFFSLHIIFYSSYACSVKPFLIRGPQNQTAVVGNSVTFQCRVGGEPVPDVLWRRSASGGNMPLRK